MGVASPSIAHPPPPGWPIQRRSRWAPAAGSRAIGRTPTPAPPRHWPAPAAWSCAVAESRRLPAAPRFHPDCAATRRSCDPRKARPRCGPSARQTWWPPSPGCAARPASASGTGRDAPRSRHPRKRARCRNTGCPHRTPIPAERWPRARMVPGPARAPRVCRCRSVRDRVARCHGSSIYHNLHAHSRTGLEHSLRIHEVGRSPQTRPGGGDVRRGVCREARRGPTRVVRHRAAARFRLGDSPAVAGSSHQGRAHPGGARRGRPDAAGDSFACQSLRRAAPLAARKDAVCLRRAGRFHHRHLLREAAPQRVRSGRGVGEKEDEGQSLRALREPPGNCRRRPGAGHPARRAHRLLREGHAGARRRAGVERKCMMRFFTAIAVVLFALSTAAARAPAPRQRLSFDSGWKFFLGDPASAQSPAFEDAAWRSVTLPHDWSIEGQPDSKNPSGGAEGFFPTGVGWYRRSFDSPKDWTGQHITVEFEGVYMNATVWLNGEKLGTHPYGYTAFFYDLTPYLKFGGRNVLAVRVDDSQQQTSRWYPGSGIYRHVWVTLTGPVHVAQWGVFVATPEVSAARAKVVVRTQVEGAGPAAATIETTLFGPDGRKAGAAQGPAGAPQELAVANPALWSPETPKLYRAVTRVLIAKKVVDEVETPFGIRSLGWSAEKGFLLNGKPGKMVGGSVHHDNGVLGAAAFDRAEERRVELLKAAGFNAIRTAHNPPSPAFLAACDRLGMLVMDEAFDCWERAKKPIDYHLYFKDWWQRDIDAMVLRDRNHPSVVMWSIGNEVPERGVEAGAQTAKTLADYLQIGRASCRERA